MHLCIYCCMHVCMYVSMYQSIYLCMYVWMYVCEYVCMFIFLQISISFSMNIFFIFVCLSEWMDEYMRYGIEKNLSISSEYINFIVINLGAMWHETRLEDTLDSLEVKLGELEKVSKRATSASETTSNLVDHLKKRIEKVDIKWRSGDILNGFDSVIKNGYVLADFSK